MTAIRLMFVGSLVVGLSACGSGGSDKSSTPNPTPPTPSGNWIAGVFQPSTNFKSQCAIPRGGNSGDLTGSITAENNWLRSWTNELYLWYRDVIDQNPAATSTTAEYFDLMKTRAATSSGTPKDQFHFTYSTTDWEALSQTGVSLGYGVEWSFVSTRAPRRIVIAYTEPGSPAANNNLARGAELLAVDGVDAVYAGDQASVDRLNAGLSPHSSTPHTFTIRDLGASATRTITMTPVNVTATPVPLTKTIATTAGLVGYVLYNSHLDLSEDALRQAFTTLRTANVTDLVLDVRYNGGGRLAIASEVAYMIAGSTATSGRTFERLVFNDKYTSTDPVTGQPLSPIPFLTTTQGFSGPSGRALPSLNLSRVFVLTGADTCSASESVINSLRGVDVQVIQIGSTTCGKPYGFYPTDNCGTTYFSVQFKGVNAKGFGDYPDGFSPNNTSGIRGEVIPGCSVGDDFTRALGDENEGRLAAALAYRQSGPISCPAATGFGVRGFAKNSLNESLEASNGKLYRGPWAENRVLSEQ